MSDRESAFDEDLRAVLAAASSSTTHPPVATLAAWRREELAAAANQEVARHLAACRECVDLLLALADVERPAAGEESTVPAVGEVDGVMAAVLASRRRRMASPSGWRRALAAALLLAVLGLGLVAARLHRETRRLEAELASARAAPGWERPEADVPVVDLYPRSFTLRAPADGQRVELPRGAGLVVLVVTPPASAPLYPAHRVAIVDARGRELWRAPATPSEAGSFVVALPRRFAERRGLTLRLLGEGRDGEELVEDYAIEFALR